MSAAPTTPAHLGKALLVAFYSLWVGWHLYGVTLALGDSDDRVTGVLDRSVGFAWPSPDGPRSYQSGSLGVSNVWFDRHPWSGRHPHGGAFGFTFSVRCEGIEVLYADCCVSSVYEMEPAGDGVALGGASLHCSQVEVSP